VIYEPELIVRRDHIHGRLNDVDRVDASLRKRIRRHDGLIAHMEIAYSTRRKLWYRSIRIQKQGEEKVWRGSMESQESRDEFVKMGLEKEWAAMRIEGASEETAIELE
jgi:hypothetical protein